MTTTSYPRTTPRTGAAPATDRMIGLGAAVGPVLAVLSSAAWVAEAAEPRAILQFWAFVGFALTFVGFSRRLEPKSANAAAAVLALGLLGCAGGIAFAAEVIFVDYFDIERLNAQQTASTFLMLRLPGLTFPLTLVGSAWLLGRHRLIGTKHAALLALGGVGFPLSRIGEIAELAVVADVVLAAAIVPLGWSTARAIPD